MVKSQEMVESLKSTNGGERDEHLLFFVGLNRWGRKEALEKAGESINTPCFPTIT
jgi:hypothetical protein